MRNAEASKERILEAAMEEFSAHGIAGARVDRIATAAGCNKNLIYIYFESKEKLFTTVLSHYLVPAYEHLKFTPEDLSGYAGRVFDFSVANPALMRLLVWFTLEQKADEPTERDNAHTEKVRALASARKAGLIGDGFSPDFLLSMVMTLATMGTAASPLGPAPVSGKKRDALRKEVMAAVSTLAHATLASARR
ncbi:transcriptional regulator, TetR family [Luteibacter sp. UNCMF331Sha3.1]|uniref:TetR family transcriptional regulator n=1 Tax=Luteibacter sp. UNCMF331Sha3.1 TaxID=1502760 RepID=UPI0008B3A6FB|nr:TetR family transcriptional regulator [Luteibacter sp. UNCMF331Sha3.1]SEN18841.1 transcriptional regulator, TetR family [Luteibacter sp. UNCMF331Sha3.1]